MAARRRRVQRVWYGLGAFLVAAGLFHLAVFVVDGGPWAGPVPWRKPATFGLSFGLTLITITWVASYLQLSERLRNVLLGVFAADCFVEVGGITLQAWRGVPSHINRETAFDSAVSTVLAAGGGVLIVVLGIMAVAAFRPGVGLSGDMRLALRAGFVTLMIGLATGAAMIARGVIEVDTGSQETAYAVTGFLKLAHGVSLHGVLVLPALAWLLAFIGWNEARRLRAVRLVTIAYGLAIAIALVYSVLTA
ncbi:hypothetical protein [Actinomadura rudentiformis]|uniref:hypothetical protein n=1 Tax=Actinomadura rudentiformis TaxID=359158 RepID=UPI001CEF63D8|nr:hypothetical protein [Actinomadura rudentiformis]